MGSKLKSNDWQHNDCGFLQANLYNSGTERLRLLSEEGTGIVDNADPKVADTDEREVMAWLDMPLIYPEFAESLVRMAHQASDRGGLVSGLRTLLLGEENGLLVKLENYLHPPPDSAPQTAGEGTE